MISSSRRCTGASRPVPPLTRSLPGGVASSRQGPAQCVVARAFVPRSHAARRHRRSGVVAKFGIPPASIPMAALVGDDADGSPGPALGRASAPQVLGAYGHSMPFRTMRRRDGANFAGRALAESLRTSHRGVTRTDAGDSPETRARGITRGLRGAARGGRADSALHRNWRSELLGQRTVAGS